jgi:hypothetical protein
MIRFNRGWYNQGWLYPVSEPLIATSQSCQIAEVIGDYIHPTAVIVHHWVNSERINGNNLQMIVVVYSRSVLMLKRAVLFMSQDMM